MRRNTISVIFFTLFLLSACQNEDLSGEAGDESPAEVNYLQAKDGRIYGVSCLRENRGAILSQNRDRVRGALSACETSQRSSSERGFWGYSFAYFPPAFAPSIAGAWSFWGGVFGYSYPGHGFPEPGPGAGPGTGPGVPPTPAPSQSPSPNSPPWWSSPGPNYTPPSLDYFYGLFGFGGFYPGQAYPNPFSSGPFPDLYGGPGFGNGYFGDCLQACFSVAPHPRRCARRRCLNAVFPNP